MRRNDKKITDPEEIQKVLENNQLCRIALSDGDNPYVLPVNFGYRDNRLFIHSATEGKKLDIIKRNNKVCFEISDSISSITTEKACGFGTRYRSVIGTGRIKIVTDYRKKIQGLDAIMYQHSKKNGWTYKESEVKKMVILEIEIESLSGKKSGVS